MQERFPRDLLAEGVVFLDPLQVLRRVCEPRVQYLLEVLLNGIITADYPYIVHVVRE